MSPPPALPLDHHHLIISNSSSMVDHSSLLLGLALRSTSLDDDLSLSPSNILTTDPSLTLSLLCSFQATTQPDDHHDQSSSRDYNNNNDDEISSFSNSTVSVKRPERDEERPDDDDAAAAAINSINDEYEVFNNNIGLDGGGSRKKLRLNKEQSALLEDSFKLHSTLNPKQKEALARPLNLRPRQVEVWFQNRRARTKLKQTEVDCEFLKKCCKRLAEENQKLQKELQELKLQFYLQLPSARLTMCPSCESWLLPAKNNHANFLTSSKKRMIFNPFTKPSAAC